MSDTFSLLSWLSRVPQRGSCIRAGMAQGEFRAMYYALAEDRKGSHCPYPLLPGWGRAVFDWKIEVEGLYRTWAADLYGGVARGSALVKAGRWDARLLDWFYRKFLACPRRGHQWWFYCQSCGHRDFYVIRLCHACGATQARNTRVSRWVRLEHAVIDWGGWWRWKREQMDAYRAWRVSVSDDFDGEMPF